AAEKNVALEITTRKGHSMTNGHVAALAREFKASLVINNDAHTVGDMLSKDMRKKVALGAGLTEKEFRKAEQNSLEIVQRIMRKRVERLKRANGQTAQA
ncbi:MAG: hypothetical protein PHO79_07565, partial [Desulfoplanes sp.]|nr:hypothetical protein [Desulfoplanes sp.]